MAVVNVHVRTIYETVGTGHGNGMEFVFEVSYYQGDRRISGFTYVLSPV